ncbi:hypothetical protein [Azospirillum canadense]|nr:hypothetical protein [Azospirillum canadense]MCW2241819.1 hypothetical protein [Azospirillum canadense]
MVVTIAFIRGANEATGRPPNRKFPADPPWSAAFSINGTLTQVQVSLA